MLFADLFTCFGLGPKSFRGLREPPKQFVEEKVPYRSLSRLHDQMLHYVCMRKNKKIKKKPLSKWVLLQLSRAERSLKPLSYLSRAPDGRSLQC